MSADPWRNRARRAVVSRLRDGLRTNGDAPHYVICGSDPLTYRVVRELTRSTDARITVVLPTRRRLEGPDLAEIKGIRIIRADLLNEDTFRAAGLAGADGLALMRQDDVGNIHAALCAQEVEPRVRLVLRMFSPRLGEGVKRLFADCEVLSDSVMAAPAFVAAALGEPAPTNFRHAGRTLYVARRADVRPDSIVCGLADTRERNNPRVLPADQSRADLVLAEVMGQPVGTEVAARRIVQKRRRRRPFFALFRGLRWFVNRKLGVATISVLSVATIVGGMLARLQGLDGWQGLYVTLLTTITGPDVDLDESFRVQAMQVLLTVSGLALVPLITAVVVDAIVNARLALNAGRLNMPREGHVVVVGVGNVGTRIIRQLYDLSIEVVAIDRNPEARGAPVARQLNIPLIIGDAAQEAVLRAASVATCQALVVVSTDDVSNLQAALNGRSLKPDLRVVMRLFDGDLADKIQKAFNIATSRSVSYLAAPAFAAALENRDVIATIPVDRHVLLVAEVVVTRGSLLDGTTIRDATRAGEVRVIALAKFGEPRPIWTPSPGFQVSGGDRLTVVARRSGLGWLLRQTSEQPEGATES
ncbi:NAD-binding protein [Phytohabitans rumicis]|nr:NAD-binding protein [Phytohabitans rumicis]